jgi:glucokinase
MYSIGVDLGGTKICTGLLNEAGNLVASVEVPTEAQYGPQHVMDRIYETIRKILDQVNREALAGIGIAAPGPLDYKTGVLLSPPNLPGWDRIPLRDIIAEKTGLSTYLDNDANAAAIAEYLYGAGERAENMVYVTVSTGIGAGLILDGKIRRGQTGSSAEVGHMIIEVDGTPCLCGNKGCLEVLASGTAIARTASDVYGKPLNTKQVVDLANQGDDKARQILDYAFHALGIGMLNVVNLFDPSVIVIGGGVSQIGEPLFRAVRAELAANLFRAASLHPVQVVPARLGTRAGVIGAGALSFLERAS